VDDEATIAMVAGKMLKRLGYAVESYTDSVKALAAFEQEPTKFALIITDFSMPELNGLELAAEVKRISPKTPILLTSGFHEAFTNRDAAALPVDDVISKPFDYRSLAAAVEQAIPRTLGDTYVKPAN
jgi:CheY-like chemotaxis protein